MEIFFLNQTTQEFFFLIKQSGSFYFQIKQPGSFTHFSLKKNSVRFQSNRKIENKTIPAVFFITRLLLVIYHTTFARGNYFATNTKNSEPGIFTHVSKKSYEQLYTTQILCYFFSKKSYEQLYTTQILYHFFSRKSYEQLYTTQI